MRSIDPLGRRRRGALILLAAVLVIAGLVLAATAPAGPSSNNKVDAYGGPTPVAPTNPKTKAECDKYYTAANQLFEARGCRATAAYNGALKKCAKKKGAKKAACKKAAKSAYTKAKAKVAKQKKAEEACQRRVQHGVPEDRSRSAGLPGAVRRAERGSAGVHEEGTERLGLNDRPPGRGVVLAPAPRRGRGAPSHGAAGTGLTPAPSSPRWRASPRSPPWRSPRGRRARGALAGRPRARRARGDHRAERGLDDRRAGRRGPRRGDRARARGARRRRGVGARAVGSCRRAARRGARDGAARPRRHDRAVRAAGAEHLRNLAPVRHLRVPAGAGARLRRSPAGRAVRGDRPAPLARDRRERSAAWLLATTAALTANRAGVGLCALALTAAVALAPRGRGVGPLALTVVLAATASTLVLGGDLAAAEPRRAPAGAAARARRRRRRGPRGARGRGHADALDAGRRACRDASRPRASCSPTAAGRAAAIRATGAPASGAPRSRRRPSVRSRATAPGRSSPQRAPASSTSVPSRPASRTTSGLQEWVELGIAGLLAVIAWYLAVGLLAAARRLAAARGRSAPGAARAARRLAAAARRRRVPAGESARLALGAAWGPGRCGRSPRAGCSGRRTRRGRFRASRTSSRP